MKMHYTILHIRKKNFVVPDITLLADESGQSSTKPGMFTNIIETLSPKDTYKLCFDGKKINSGKTKHGGDINLFGFEDAPTLKDRQQRR